MLGSPVPGVVVGIGRAALKDAVDAAASASLIVLDITIHASFLPHDDADASLAFYRDTLGFAVRNDVAYDGMRWITVGPADQPDTSIVLAPPAAGPGVTDDGRRTLAVPLGVVHVAAAG